MQKKIFVSAIEVSGDLHAANLVRAIQQRLPSVEWFGVGGENLAACGVTVMQDLTKNSAVGLMESLVFAKTFLKALREITRLLEESRPQAVLLVDGQGFHVPLARAAKKLGIPVIYYISPQEWLWGTDKGGKNVIAVCDLIVSIFPEEHAFYTRLGAHSVFNGHPLVSIVKPTIDQAVFVQRHKLNPDKPIISIFPGSRQQEIKFLYAELLSAAEQFSRTHNLVVVAANEYYFEQLQELSVGRPVTVILKDNYNAMAASQLVISSTGTITLEAAIIGTPIIAVYRMQAFSYWLAMKLFGHKLPKYKALPNMIMGKEIMPELIQDLCTATNIATKMKFILEAPSVQQDIRNQFTLLRERLACEDVLGRNAQAIVDFLK